MDDKIYVHEGVRILGLGGSMRYKPGGWQYTEREMRRRIRRLWPKLLWNRGFDILVTHAPAYSINDGRDLPHQGFKAFLKLMDKYPAEISSPRACTHVLRQDSINVSISTRIPGWSMLLNAALSR